MLLENALEWKTMWEGQRASLNIDVKLPSGDDNHDNYDRALKKGITAEEYNKIIAEAEYYAALYNNGSLSADIKAYLENTPDAVYNLFSHNCDTVAGKILGIVDPYFVTCQEGVGHSTPNESFYIRTVFLQDTWGDVEIGSIDFFEAGIGKPSLNYIIHVNLMKKLKEIKNGCGEE